MNDVLNYFLSGIAGYLLGAVPFAVLVSKLYGVDILKAGSGNPGATNVKRVVGKTAGNVVFVLDFLKGAVAAGWPVMVLSGEGDGFYMALAGLVGAIVGHSYSVFIKFRGGRGVAVTMGGLVVLMPVVLGVGLVVWVVVFYATRYVSVASMMFGLSLPVTAYVMEVSKERLVLSGVLVVFILIRHMQNIKRLYAGTENRFDKKEK